MKWVGLLLVSTVFVTCIVSVRSEEYLGCYKDNSDRMFGHMKDFSSRMTRELCIDYCKNSGYAYAGLQFGSQCFCGNNQPSGELKVEEKDCSQKCSGNNDQMCGRDYRNSVYKTGIVPRDFSKDYLGCFKDSNDDRMFGHMNNINSMTIQECVSYCKNSDYAYAGLQYGFQCFCGNDRPKDELKVDEKDCSQNCAGDSQQKCGRDWRNSVFKTGNVPTDLLKNYLGCFKDSDDRMYGYMKDFYSSMTIQRCTSHCKDSGYLYAGLQFGNQCFCGNNQPKDELKVDEKDCSQTCSGDSKQKCGRDWRSSVYKTGYPAREYLGCYKDQLIPRSLPNDFVNFGKNLTIDSCIKHCEVMGHKYAGVQFGKECFCGDDAPLEDTKVAESECDYKCTGDDNAVCGGGWRNGVYSTGLTRGRA